MSNVINGEQLVKTKVAADILGLGEGTLCNWRTNKLVDLPFIKIGRTVRYRMVDLVAFIEGKKQQQSSERTDD